MAAYGMAAASAISGSISAAKMAAALAWQRNPSLSGG